MNEADIKKASDRGQLLREEIATRQDELDQIEAKFIALGKGRYGFALVIITAGAKPGFKLKTEDEEAARKLAGEDFLNVFDRTVTFKPCKSFEDILPKLLTPAKARDLRALCEVPGKAGSQRVKWD